jgi:hypothetical protein
MIGLTPDIIEAAVIRRGQDLLRRSEGLAPTVFDSRWWANSLLDWCMKDEGFKVQLFRFVDTFPTLKTPEQVHDHLVDYLTQPEVTPPPFLGMGLKAGGMMKGALTKTVSGQITSMAEKIIAVAARRCRLMPFTYPRTSLPAYPLSHHGRLELKEIVQFGEHDTGDAGGALGAALFASHQVLDKPRVSDNLNDSQKGSYLGPAFKSDEIEAWLSGKGITYHRYDGAEVPAHAASLIAQGKVIGWFRGRMEFGPRALGARSILGDPRDRETQTIMNLKIKYRESFRPFAPSCLLEDVSEYFEMDCESPYMLLVAPVRKDRQLEETEEQKKLFGIEKLKIPRSDIPAVTHVDYSARIQTVNERDHPDYYKLIREFKRLTGYGIIVNTSFNVRGEPIVCTPEEAYLCFMRTEMDALVLEDIVLYKDEQDAIKEEHDWREIFELD